MGRRTLLLSPESAGELIAHFMTGRLSEVPLPRDSWPTNVRVREDSAIELTLFSNEWVSDDVLEVWVHRYPDNSWRLECLPTTTTTIVA